MIQPDLIFSMNEFLAAWSERFWRVSWQGGVYFLVIWMTCKIFRRMPASVRGWLWWLGAVKLLIGLVALPTLTLPIRLPSPPINAATHVARPSESPGRDDMASPPPLAAGIPTPEETPSLPPFLALQGGFFLLWMGGVAFSFTRMIRAAIATHRISRDAVPVSDGETRSLLALLGSSAGLKRLPELCESPLLVGPVVMGLLRPRILMPTDAGDRFTREELRMALAHELAHLRRRDLWYSLVPAFAQAFFFYHPLSWVAAREWKLASETACDEEALRLTEATPQSYGSFLVKLVEAARNRRTITAMGATPDFRMMDGRLKMLQTFTRQPRGRFMRFGLLGVILLAAVLIAPWRVVARGDIPVVSEREPLVVTNSDKAPPEIRPFLEKIDEAYAHLNSFSLKLSSHSVGGGPTDVEGTIQFTRPNLVALHLVTRKRTLDAVSDGSQTFILDSNQKGQYRFKNQPCTLKELIGLIFPPGDSDSTGMTSSLALFAGAPLIETFSSSVRLGEDTTLDGEPVQSLVQSQKVPKGPETEMTLFVSAKDHLVRRISMTLPGRKGGYEEKHTEIRINPTLAPAVFAFHPPSGAKAVEIPPTKAEQAKAERIKNKVAPIQPVNGVFDAKIIRAPVTRIAGRVVTPEGRPVNGARVWASFYDTQTNGYKVAASVKADAQGHFEFPNAKALSEQHEIRTPDLLVMQPGQGIGFARIQRDETETILHLAPLTTVSVRFQDAQKHPIPGLHVYVKALAHQASSLEPGGRTGTSYFYVPQTWRSKYSGVTDASGLCHIPDLPEGYEALIQPDDDRYAPVDSETRILLPRQKGQMQSLKLREAGSAQGKVTYPDGRPAVGFKVGAQGIEPMEGWSEDITDTEGNYTLHRMLPGTYNIALWLTDEQQKEWTAKAHEDVHIAGGETQTGADFQLEKGAIITGRVTAETGEPVANLYMGVYGTAHPNSSGGVQSVETTRDGVYTFRVPPGEHRVYIGAELPGFLPLEDEENHIREAYQKNISVRDGEMRTQDFRLPLDR